MYPLFSSYFSLFNTIWDCLAGEMQVLKGSLDRRLPNGLVKDERFLKHLIHD